MINVEEVAYRKFVLLEASAMLEGVFEKYPPEDYKIVNGSAGPFAVAPNTTMTRAEQVVHLAINVAEWLLGERD